MFGQEGSVWGEGSVGKEGQKLHLHGYTKGSISEAVIKIGGEKG